ncbi:MAG: hypothetical protein P4L11_08705 [Geothrix sp.]|nr:hypothetical protein [Geothrix sp.]
MRVLLIALLLSTTAAFAQLGASPAPASDDLQRTWTLGGQVYGPTLTGHFNGTISGQAIGLNLDSDLGLGKDKTTPGFFIDYQGPRFAFQLSNGSAEYRGDRTLTQQITLNGKTFSQSDRVQSHVKLATVDGIWTIKFVKGSDAWLGLDLGAQVWKLDMDATDLTNPATASTNVSVPIPQIGLSAGGRGLDGGLEAKAYVHYLGYKQAKYTLLGADLRYFPVRWFGLRAFYEGSSFDVPKGSVKDDLAFQLDRKGFGFGGVFRF